MNPNAALQMVIAETPLLPCPFCSGRAEMRSGGNQDMQATIEYHFIGCQSCGAGGPKFSEHNLPKLNCKSNAVSAWNKRSFM